MSKILIIEPDPGVADNIHDTLVEVGVSSNDIVLVVGEEDLFQGPKIHIPTNAIIAQVRDAEVSAVLTAYHLGCGSRCTGGSIVMACERMSTSKLVIGTSVNPLDNFAPVNWHGKKSTDTVSNEWALDLRDLLLDNLPITNTLVQSMRRQMRERRIA